MLFHPTHEPYRTVPITYERIFRAKGILDACSTLPEMAAALERTSQSLLQMHQRGLVLRAPIDDDYAFIVTQDPAAAAEFGLRQSDEPSPAGSPAPLLTAIHGGKLTKPDQP